MLAAGQRFQAEIFAIFTSSQCVAYHYSYLLSNLILYNHIYLSGPKLLIPYAFIVSVKMAPNLDDSPAKKVTAKKKPVYHRICKGFEFV